MHACTRLCAHIYTHVTKQNQTATLTDFDVLTLCLSNVRLADVPNVRRTCRMLREVPLEVQMCMGVGVDM